MDHCESKWYMIRLLFGWCLSEINQYITFWYYGILLPNHEDTSPSSSLNISLDDLKNVFLSYGLIYYERDTVKFHLNHWETFMLENRIHKCYFDKFNVTRFNSYNTKMYYIGIGSELDNKLTPSTRFLNNSCPRISSSLSKFIKKKWDRMKMLLNINVIFAGWSYWYFNNDK